MGAWRFELQKLARKGEPESAFADGMVLRGKPIEDRSLRQGFHLRWRYGGHARTLGPEALDDVFLSWRKLSFVWPWALSQCFWFPEQDARWDAQVADQALKHFQAQSSAA